MESLFNATLDELRQMEYLSLEGKHFDCVIIVPMDKIHDSGYRCMKFIMTRRDEVVGVESGYSDVIHLDGIGGYGVDYAKALSTQLVPRVGWSMDCLPGSNCVRIMADHECFTHDWNGSDYCIYSGHVRR